MTPDELRTALEPEGTTLADVAESQDVELDTLIDALVRAHEERIAQAVEDGRLTQDEADERLADLEEQVTERVNSADLGGRGHHGPAAGPATDRLPEPARRRPRRGRRGVARRRVPPCRPR